MTVSPWRVVAIAVLTVLIARYALIPISERLAGLGHGPFWQSLPWFLIAVIWVALFVAIRRAKRAP